MYINSNYNYVIIIFSAIIINIVVIKALFKLKIAK